MEFSKNYCMDNMPGMVNDVWCKALEGNIKGTMEVYKLLLMYFGDAFT